MFKTAVKATKSSALIALLTVILSYSVKAQTLRDPTLPLNSIPNSGERTLVLHSIIHGGERKLAVINGELLREGEPVGGYENTEVAEIRPDSVTVNRNGQSIQLTLVDQYTSQSRAAP